MAYDIDKILHEYGDIDFGFTAVDETEYEQVKEKLEKESYQKDITVEQYKERMKDLEQIIMPFLTNLYKSREQAYIHWPNRGNLLEKQMQKVLKLTRG
jgi:histone deacetylase complex regulatory component SIN3|tara:strand:- start:768 stop:1061 length:294 start_codon:yes stop_codon:yes gene_type:complete